MGKGKKASGKSSTSAGIHRNVKRSTLTAMRTSKTDAEKLLDKQTAWLKGKNPWITIANPNKEQTNKPFIRVRMNDHMGGTAKERDKKMFIIK